MSAYNGQGFYSPNGATTYHHASVYPRPGVQVQVPVASPNPIAQTNVAAVNTIRPDPMIPNQYLQQSSHLQQPIQHTQGTYDAVVPRLVPVNGSAQVVPYVTPQSTSGPPVDYSSVLLSLAEEFFAAAYGGGLGAELVERESDLRMYYKLIASGLHCLGTALRQWRLPPLLEAKTRLRYATILFQETENYMQAEEILNQGISLCDRHRFLDLKYNMQFLLTHIMFTANPRAALKFLDGVIRDVEAYRHLGWVYVFRFLRTSLSLKISLPQESLIATSHLRIVVDLARDNGDHTILATASIMEALTYLHRSNSTESIEQAQRALATARSSQLNPSSQMLPELVSMSFFVDICCSLQHFDPTQAMSKMQAMQGMLDASSGFTNWSTDGIFHVPVSEGTARNLQHKGLSTGVLQTDTAGGVSVCLNWLTKDEIYALGYTLSGAVVLHKNASDGNKAEQYLKEAKRLLRDMQVSKTGSLTISEPRYLWRQTLLCQVQIYLVFAFSARSSWLAAKDELSLLREQSTVLPDAQLESISLFLQYLEGLIHQATGDLSSALAIFESPLFTLPNTRTYQTTSPYSQSHRDLCLLAALNSLLIVRSPGHSKHAQFSTLLATLAPLALSSPSRNIQAAFHLLRATSVSSHTSVDLGPTGVGIVKTKQYLQSALQAAKHCANNQLMCITLNFMSWKFFRGVVAEQAEKSARASVNMAKKGRDTLWIGVADGVLAETLEVQGKGPEAESVRREAREVAGRLPASMQREVEVSGVQDEDTTTMD